MVRSRIYVIVSKLIKSMKNSIFVIFRIDLRRTCPHDYERKGNYKFYKAYPHLIVSYKYGTANLPVYVLANALRSRGSSKRNVSGMKSSLSDRFLTAAHMRSYSCRLLRRPSLLVSRLQLGMWFTICSPM